MTYVISSSEHMLNNYILREAIRFDKSQSKHLIKASVHLIANKI